MRRPRQRGQRGIRVHRQKGQGRIVGIGSRLRVGGEGTGRGLRAWVGHLGRGVMAEEGDTNKWVRARKGDTGNCETQKWHLVNLAGSG